jgi:hypothetical protein
MNWLQTSIPGSSTWLRRTLCYHHWILYDRTRTDDIDKQAKSWQHKTGTEDRDEAIRVLVGRGFLEIGMSIDEEGTLRLVNNPHFHRQWWAKTVASLTHARCCKRPDGKVFPFETQTSRDHEWNSNYVQAPEGDLLFLDNFRVAHGCLPYRNGRKEGD